MSKAVAVFATLIGGAAISVGGWYLSRMLNVDAELPMKLGTDTEEGSFKNSNGGSCVQSLFSGIKKMNGSNTSENTGISSSFFSDAQKVNGCLVVNWDKWATGTGNQRKGNFRFLWAMADDSKGFVAFATGDTLNETNAQKIKFQGVFHTMKKNDQGVWTFDKKKDLDTTGGNNKLDNTSFPKAKANLDGMKAGEEYWRFTGDNGSLTDLASLEENDDRKQESKESFKGYWVWEADKQNPAQGETADKWSENLSSTWWNKLFTSTDAKVTDAVQNVKGKWSHRKIIWKPAQKTTGK